MINLNRRYQTGIFLGVCLLVLLNVMHTPLHRDSEDVLAHTIEQLQLDPFANVYDVAQVFPIVVSHVLPNGNSYTNRLNTELYPYNDPSLGLCSLDTNTLEVTTMFEGMNPTKWRTMARDLPASRLLSSAPLSRLVSFPREFAVPAVRITADKLKGELCVTQCTSVIPGNYATKINQLIRDGYALQFQVGGLPILYGGHEYNIQYLSQFADSFNRAVPLGAMDYTRNRTVLYNHLGFYFHVKKLPQDHIRVVAAYVTPSSLHSVEEEVKEGDKKGQKVQKCHMEAPQFLDETTDNHITFTYSYKFIDVDNPHGNSIKEQRVLNVPRYYKEKSFDSTWSNVRGDVVSRHVRATVCVVALLACAVFLRESLTGGAAAVRLTGRVPKGLLYVAIHWTGSAVATLLAGWVMGALRFPSVVALVAYVLGAFAAGAYTKVSYVAIAAEGVAAVLLCVFSDLPFGWYSWTGVAILAALVHVPLAAVVPLVIPETPASPTAAESSVKPPLFVTYGAASLVTAASAHTPLYLLLTIHSSRLLHNREYTFQPLVYAGGIAAYVASSVLATTIARRIWLSGTSGEVVLGEKDSLKAAAVPAGAAFLVVTAFMWKINYDFVMGTALSTQVEFAAVVDSVAVGAAVVYAGLSCV